MSEEQEKMVLDNEKLIYYVLKKINLYSEYEELYDLGLIGLVKGVKTFDKEKNVCLSTYLYSCIKNEILCHKRKKRFDTISIETEIGENLTIGDTICDENANVELSVIKSEMMNDICKFIETLPVGEQFIINTFYGLSNSKRLNQQEISKYLGISQAQVSRKINKIIKKIKEAME